MAESLRQMMRRLYEESMLSIPQIAARTGIPASTVRARLLEGGVTLRTTSEALRVREGIGDHLRGKKRPPFTVEHRANISAAMRQWADKHADGLRLAPSGYLEYTRGPHKGRSVHVVKMEERLGRALRDDENVHHIDGDRSNNEDDNLALVTKAGHGRLHRREDALQGIERKRVNGRFS